MLLKLHPGHWVSLNINHISIQERPTNLHNTSLRCACWSAFFQVLPNMIDLHQLTCTRIFISYQVTLLSQQKTKAAHVGWFIVHHKTRYPLATADKNLKNNVNWKTMYIARCNWILGKCRVSDVVVKKCQAGILLFSECTLKNSLLTGSPPEDWLCSRGIAMSKLGDKLNVENYCPSN